MCLFGKKDSFKLKILLFLNDKINKLYRLYKN